jgi:uncharacterized ubiquitin-like protein YukD
MRNYLVLEKSNWFASDIAEYYDCSLTRANNIKAKVEELYGATEIDKQSERKTVSADNVIKVMGGIDRLTELQIYKLLKNIGEQNG